MPRGTTIGPGDPPAQPRSRTSANTVKKTFARAKPRSKRTR